MNLKQASRSPWPKQENTSYLNPRYFLDIPGIISFVSQIIRIVTANTSTHNAAHAPKGQVVQSAAYGGG